MSFLDYLCATSVIQAALALPGDKSGASLGGFPALERLVSGLDEDEAARWRKNQKDLCALRFRLLCRLSGEDSACEAALSLALTELLYPELGGLLLQRTGSGLTFELAWRLAHQAEVTKDFTYVRDLFECLSKILRAEKQEPFFLSRLSADARLVGFLLGDRRLDPLLDGIAAFENDEPPALYAGDGRIRAIAHSLDLLRGGDRPLLQIVGDAGCGKRLCLRHAALVQGRKFLYVDCGMLLANPLETVWRMVDSIRREALLHGADVCYYRLSAGQAPSDTSQREKDPAQFLHLCAQPLWDSGLLVAVCSPPDVYLIPFAPGSSQRVEIKPYARAERIALWRGFSSQYGVALDPVLYGSKYILSPREIKKVLLRLRDEGVPAPDDRMISEICMQILPPPVGSIRRSQVHVSLDDLKLPLVQKQKLLSICSHITCRHQVFDQWQMEERYPYGRNVSVLFVGPPGTGKTMAAHALSELLNLPLYRIDLSQVIDKYIGETEKRLEEIFRQAEKNNTILFFDEADAVFGKRSEVNDSKDRYANTDVSYILQRIEEYDGIVILATNLKKNIDEAFMRRMRYVVEFALPGEALRREIWETCFTEAVPTDQVDFEYLARQFEFSAGSIKNVVLNAAFAAAASGHPIEMRDLLESIRDENIKLGKSMLRQDFAEYSVLL